jgi:hypothetical protein
MAHAAAEDVVVPGQGEMRVWLEPAFMRPAVAASIPGAKKTLLAAGFLSPRGLEPCRKGALEQLRLTWDEFFAKARLKAAADLAQLQPRFERNSKQVIVYGALESPRPIVASAVLAPGFLELFKDVLGEKILVVVPNRFTAYVFPRLASEHQAFAPMIFRAFRETPWPVSVEMFEVSAAGWKCIGAYEEP